MKTMNSKMPSKRLLLSYVFDWIVIAAIAGVGAAWNNITPFHRPFSLVDLSISFPFEHDETIPTWLLIVVSLIAPAGIIFLVCLLFVPGPTVNKSTSKLLIWKRKVWELNAGWMGLALSLAIAFMFTQGLKLLFGKPRPDFLSRCRPDLSRISNNDVSSAGLRFDPLWVLVTSKVCTQTDNDILQDGFKSWPSGHSSFSWAGLLYLTLFLSSKFAVAIPFLPPRPFSTNPDYTSATAKSNLNPRRYTNQSNTVPSDPTAASMDPSHHYTDATLSPTPTNFAEQPGSSVIPIRNQAAAPPVYTLILILIPLGAAMYISSTRFTDYRHHGFDIISGSTLGIVSAWFSFRWYHLPVTRGAGWAWGPRSYQRAFGIGVGRGVYVGTEGWGGKRGDGVVTEAASKENTDYGGVHDGVSSQGVGNRHRAGVETSGVGRRRAEDMV